MKKVFVLTEGDYSDYHIVGVFDSKEKAEEFRDRFHAGMMIEEWKVNPTREGLPPGMKSFWVRIYKNGEVRSVDQCEYSEGDKQNFNIDTNMKGRQWMFGMVFAKNEEHAVKIFNEKRVQFIATGKWDEDIENRHK